MRAVVLAAGLGERLRPLTDRIAKPMMPIVNRPLLEHTIMQLKSCDVRMIGANLFYRPETITDYFGDGRSWGVDLTWRKEKRLSGPAGALHLFGDFMAGERDLLVVSGDCLHAIDLVAFISAHREHGAPLSFVGKEMSDVARFGVAELDARGYVTRFTQKPEVPAQTRAIVNCGIYCVRTDLVRRIPHGANFDFSTNLIPILLGEHEPVFCFKTEAYWVDIGEVGALRLANLDAIAGRVPASIPGTRCGEVWKEESVSVNATAIVRGPVAIGRGAIVGPHAEIHGPAVIGEQSIVGGGAFVRGSLLMAHTLLSPDSITLDGVVASARA